MKPERIVPIGINYLLIEYPEKIAPEINAAVSQFWKQIEEQNNEGIVSIIPTYRSLLVEYDPLTWQPTDLQTKIEDIVRHNEGDAMVTAGRLVSLPVLYGGEHGPDLADVAVYNDLTPTEVIKIHTANTYRVYMLGFNPGYPYMGGLDPRIAMPRLEVPRTKVPAGSVAIGGEQTGVYSTISPGGWRLIGHTPIPLFDPQLADPVLLRPGDNIRFQSITEEDYQHIVDQVRDGSYKLKISAGDLS